ncbi:MAG: haloacid dehalogenase type II [Candidatus Latescibacteria bacterium]|nr:haloacid dehalogenase type II [Candidatus Latescibacterota bacterium]
MSVDLSTIKALTFDVGGTVFDWHRTIRDEIQRIVSERNVEIDTAQFANDWRSHMFAILAEVRSGQLPWMNADEMHRRALDEIMIQHSTLELTSLERDDLNRVWHRLRVWPDAPEAIEQLRTRYTVIVLTVLSWAIVVDSSKAVGISWDGILSCEFLGHYKFDVSAYQVGVRLLGIEPHEAMMVASHPWDLNGAKAAGLHTAYVARPGEKGEGNDPDLSPQPDCDINATGFRDLTKQLLS